MFEAPRQIGSAVGTGNFPVALRPQAGLSPDVDFAKFWFAIRHGWMTILGATVVALAAAALFIAFAPREYTAVTQILIDPSDLRALGNDATPSAQMSDAAVLQVESQVRVLASDAVLARVVEAEGLDHDPEFVREPSFINRLMGKGTIAGGSTLAALNELKRRVVVKRAERTYVVEVDVTSRDPQKAVRIANAIAQAYLAEQTQVRSDSARQVSQSLSARLKELKDRVREAEENIEAFKARNNMVGGSSGQLVTEQQLTELDNQLGEARTRTAEAKARLDQVELAQRTRNDSGAFPEALQSPTITALRSQYAEVVRREAEQTATLGARHPAVIDIEAQAERLQQMITAEINRAAASERTEYESAKASEQTLAANFDKLKQTALDASTAMVGLRELEREAQASRSVYEAFLARARETSEQEQVDTKNIRVLSKADLPQRRSSPPPSLLVALGAALFGAAAGTGIVLLRAPAQNAVPRRRRDGALRGTLAGIGFLSATRSEIPVLATLPEADVSFALSAVDDPASPFAREIGTLYDELSAGNRGHGNPSVLVVAADAEDEATVALTLAAFAAATQRVLVIDADLDRRTLSAIDAENGDAALIDVAIGRRLLSDVITIDRETNINLVPFVSPGSRRDRPINDGDLKRAFEQTRRYDLVIVAAISNGDPSLGFFAGLVDHIVLVTRVEDYDSGSFGRFVARLALDRRKIRGAVLTGAG